MPLSTFALEVDEDLEITALALLGPSGAGKTSLLDLIAGLRRAEAGRVELAGETVAEAGGRRFVPARARQIGYVPQEGALFPHYSVRENLLYGAHPRSPDAGAAHELLERVVTTLALGPVLARGIAALSGGERQRVALGRALLSRPRLLLLDEPLSGLDRALRERVLEHLRAARVEFGLPMIYVTHYPDEALALCDQALVMEAGRIVGRGDPAGLRALR